MKALRVVLVVAVSVMIVAVTVFTAFAETIFQEDFESYEHGTNLIGQGGWVKEPNNPGYSGTTLVGNGINMSTRVANGRMGGGSGLAAASNLFGPLSEDTVHTLTFDAYANGLSHNSGLGFHNDYYSATGWWIDTSLCPGWKFISGGLTGLPGACFPGGLGQVVTLKVIVDPINLECYGIVDYRDGSTFETPHYAIDIEKFRSIDGVTIIQDYSFGGIEFDNILVTGAGANEPPVANGGPDQAVFDEATLDGTGSSDPDGVIISWEWSLIHRTDQSLNRTASGDLVTISALAAGFYDVTLTVMDDGGLTTTDSMLLSASGPCVPVDLDGDAYSVEAGDCNDNDPAINPGAAELCDGLDNNCNNEVDEGFDEDQDGFTVCDGDCDDIDASINPDALELPGNWIDENCDGSLGNCDPNAEWKNHGEYVRCVAQGVEALVGAGAITQEQGDQLLGSAAQSNVGKK